MDRAIQVYGGDGLKPMHEFFACPEKVGVWTCLRHHKPLNARVILWEPDEETMARLNEIKEFIRVYDEKLFVTVTIDGRPYGSHLIERVNDEPDKNLKTGDEIATVFVYWKRIVIHDK